MSTLRKAKATEILKLYQAFHSGESFTLKEVLRWAENKGYDLSSNFDPEASARRNLKRALKESNVNDPQGRKVPKFIHVGDDMEGNPTWSEIAITPPPVMQKAVNALRGKGTQVLIQAQTVAHSYNDNYNEGQPIQMDLFDIPDEVMEGALKRKRQSTDETDEE